MHPPLRYPLSLALALALLVLSLALLGAPAIRTPLAVSAPRPFTIEVPQQCPLTLGYNRVPVARYPALYRYADQNADSEVCVRFPRSRSPAVVLIDGNGRGSDSSGDPQANPCRAHFVFTTPEHVPIPELAGDVEWVDRHGTGDACLFEVPSRFDVVVIDNTLDDQDN